MDRGGPGIQRFQHWLMCFLSLLMICKEAYAMHSISACYYIARGLQWRKAVKCLHLHLPRKDKVYIRHDSDFCPFCFQRTKTGIQRWEWERLQKGWILLLFWLISFIIVPPLGLLIDPGLALSRARGVYSYLTSMWHSCGVNGWQEGLMCERNGLLLCALPFWTVVPWEWQLSRCTALHLSSF